MLDLKILYHNFVQLGSVYNLMRILWVWKIIMLFNNYTQNVRHIHQQQEVSC